MRVINEITPDTFVIENQPQFLTEDDVRLILEKKRKEELEKQKKDKQLNG